MDEGLQVRRSRLLPGRRRHEQAEPRILEPDGTGTRWSRDIDGAADHGFRMDMTAVGTARRQHVHPKIIQRKLAAPQVECNLLRERACVLVEDTHQCLDGWIAPR